MLAARRALAVVVAAQVSRREVRWRSSNEAEREDDVGRRPAVRPGRRTRRTTTRSARVDEVGGAIKERRARGSARARRRRGGSSEPARRWKSSNEAEREDDVGRRPAVRPGRRTRRTTTRSARVDEVGGAIKERRARGSARARRRRGGSSEPARRWKSSNEAEREDDVGRRPAVRPGRRTRRTTTRSARVDEVGGARSRNDVLAARRALAVVVAAQVSRRGDGRAATKLSVRMTSVGARRCGRDGARGARRHDRRASTRSAARSRNDVLAARRALAVVVAAQVSRRGDGRAATKLSVRMTSVGARRCGRDGARGARRHDRRASTRSRRRDQGTTCSRLGARSPSSWRLK